jgi:hypothetical protein
VGASSEIAGWQALCTWNGGVNARHELLAGWSGPRSGKEGTSGARGRAEGSFTNTAGVQSEGEQRHGCYYHRPVAEPTAVGADQKHHSADPGRDCTRLALHLRLALVVFACNRDSPSLLAIARHSAPSQTNLRRRQKGRRRPCSCRCESTSRQKCHGAPWATPREARSAHLHRAGRDVHRRASGGLPRPEHRRSADSLRRRDARRAACLLRFASPARTGRARRGKACATAWRR